MTHSVDNELEVFTSNIIHILGFYDDCKLTAVYSLSWFAYVYSFKLNCLAVISSKNSQFVCVQISEIELIWRKKKTIEIKKKMAEIIESLRSNDKDWFFDDNKVTTRIYNLPQFKIINGLVMIRNTTNHGFVTLWFKELVQINRKIEKGLYDGFIEEQDELFIDRSLTLKKFTTGNYLQVSNGGSPCKIGFLAALQLKSIENYMLDFLIDAFEL